MMLAIRPLSFFPSEFVRAFLLLPPPLAEPQKKSQRTLDFFFLLLGWQGGVSSPSPSSFAERHSDSPQAALSVAAPTGMETRPR